MSPNAQEAQVCGHSTLHHTGGQSLEQVLMTVNRSKRDKTGREGREEADWAFWPGRTGLNTWAGNTAPMRGRQFPTRAGH